MRHDIVDDASQQPGPHPPWCARDHRCDFAIGGMHRSLPEKSKLPVGTVTVWREGRHRGYVVMQWSTAIRGDEAALADRLRQGLYAMQQVLQGRRDT